MFSPDNKVNTVLKEENVRLRGHIEGLQVGGEISSNIHINHISNTNGAISEKIETFVSLY